MTSHAITHPEGRRLQDNLRRVILGKDDVLALVITGLVARGHLLMEGAPGLGKTLLVRALAGALSLRFARVQCTPDLLPADVTGTRIVTEDADGRRRFELVRGPVFTQLLLADEINRATARTQSALLEAMAESQVTLAGERHDLDAPFMVLATQNPIEMEGTYPLPEAQLDRFLMRLALGYPAADQEVEMLYEQQTTHPLTRIESVAGLEVVKNLQDSAREIEVKRGVARYLVALVEATRQHPDIRLGASPRGSLALFRSAQARALLAGRRYVVPDDLQALAEPVLAHRLELTAQARYGGKDARQIVQEVVRSVPVPAA
jgi:MoxR-like ATPase